MTLERKSFSGLRSITLLATSLALGGCAENIDDRSIDPADCPAGVQGFGTWKLQDYRDTTGLDFVHKQTGMDILFLASDPWSATNIDLPATTESGWIIAFRMSADHLDGNGDFNINQWNSDVWEWADNPDFMEYIENYPGQIWHMALDDLGLIEGDGISAEEINDMLETHYQAFGDKIRIVIRDDAEDMLEWRGKYGYEYPFTLVLQDASYKYENAEDYAYYNMKALIGLNEASLAEIDFIWGENIADGGTSGIEGTRPGFYVETPEEIESRYIALNDTCPAGTIFWKISGDEDVNGGEISTSEIFLDTDSDYPATFRRISGIANPN